MRAVLLYNDRRHVFVNKIQLYRATPLFKASYPKNYLSDCARRVNKCLKIVQINFKKVIYRLSLYYKIRKM